jgi:hypothetical protein
MPGIPPIGPGPIGCGPLPLPPIDPATTPPPPPPMYGVGKIPGCCACPSTVPQLRQKRMFGAFSVPHVGQALGNPPPGPGV